MQGTALRQSMALIARHVNTLPQGWAGPPPPVAVWAAAQPGAGEVGASIEAIASKLIEVVDRDMTGFEPQAPASRAEHSATPSPARQGWIESAARAHPTPLAPPQLSEQRIALGYVQPPVQDRERSPVALSPRSDDVSAPAPSLSPAPLPCHEAPPSSSSLGDEAALQLRFGVPTAARHRPVEFLEEDAGVELPPPSSPAEEPPAAIAGCCSPRGRRLAIADCIKYAMSTDCPLLEQMLFKPPFTRVLH